jgi:hypothetical protein
MTPARGVVEQGNRHGFARSDQHDQPFCACDPGVEEVALELGEVLGEKRHDDGGKLPTLPMSPLNTSRS